MLVSLLVLAGVLIVHVPQTDFHEEAYYKASIERIEALELPEEAVNAFEVGWAKQSILPEKPQKMAGYGFRKEYDGIHDSLYVRCFYFSTEEGNYLWLNYDLLVVHSTYRKAVEKALYAKYPDLSGIYFSCAHTHSGFGGWAEGVLGEAILGGDSKEVVKMLADQTVKVVEDAHQNRRPSEVAYMETPLVGWVSNRVSPGAYVDLALRLIAFKKNDGKIALLSTFSAHPTLVMPDSTKLSADYPGMYSQMMVESGAVDFSMMAMGAVGSTQSDCGDKGFDIATNFSVDMKRVSTSNLKKMEFHPVHHFSFTTTDVEMPPLYFKVKGGWAFRPMVGEWVFGESSPRISTLKINDILFYGVSGEISGEVTQEIEQQVGLNGTHLVPTSFNGDYVGYFTHERHYFSLRRAETRDMNLYGPQNTPFWRALLVSYLSKFKEQEPVAQFK